MPLELFFSSPKRTIRTLNVDVDDQEHWSRLRLSVGLAIGSFGSTVVTSLTSSSPAQAAGAIVCNRTGRPFGRPPGARFPGSLLPT